MRYETINIYKFDELSEDAKSTAIEYFRTINEEYFVWQTEWENSLNKFCEIVNISWHEFDIYRHIDFTINLDEEVLQLSGIRAVAWLYNNIYPFIIDGKYYSINKFDNENKWYYESRHSKVIINECCTLTDFIGDYYLTAPIFKFMKTFDKKTTIESLFTECMNNWQKGYRDDYENSLTDEYIIENIKGNAYEFTMDGEIYV